LRNTSKKNMNEIKKRIAANLRKLRLDRDYSMQYVAEYMGKTDYTGYQRLENGKTEVKFEDAAILAELYKVPMETIWRGIDYWRENQAGEKPRVYQIEAPKNEVVEIKEITTKRKSIFIQLEIDGTNDKLEEQIELLRSINAVLKVQEN
jgi:transcriptional regulator with XRE-family HTH domain